MTHGNSVQKFANDVVEATENLRRGIESLPPESVHETEILSRLRDGFSGVEPNFVGLLERNGRMPIGGVLFACRLTISNPHAMRGAVGPTG